MGRAATTSEGLNWLTLTVIVLFHAGALAALFLFSWQRLVVMAVLYVLAINVGIGMCYHRLLTHRGYHVPKWLEYVMSICATTVARRRTDLLGFDASGASPAQRSGRRPAHASRRRMVGACRLDPLWRRAARADRGAVPLLARPEPRPVSCLAQQVSLASDYGERRAAVRGGWLWGGWVNGVAMVLWGVLLRVTLGLHATWLVNSATHLWGSRRFETRDDSRNNWWVALLTGGEGWHNNHHAHPVSARHGLAWYEIDPNFWGIWISEKIGLARKVQVAKFDPADPKPAGHL